MTTIDTQPPRILTGTRSRLSLGCPLITAYYGPDPAQFGDLYLPPQPGPHPVVLLLHGGCWQAQFSLNILGQLGAAFARRGWPSGIWNTGGSAMGEAGPPPFGMSPWGQTFCGLSRPNSLWTSPAWSPWGIPRGGI